MTCERLDGGRERVVSNGGGVHGEHVDARGDVAALSGTPLWVMGQKPYARVSEAGVSNMQPGAGVTEELFKLEIENHRAQERQQGLGRAERRWRLASITGVGPGPLHAIC
jgi:hypothetical protein